MSSVFDLASSLVLAPSLCIGLLLDGSENFSSDGVVDGSEISHVSLLCFLHIVNDGLGFIRHAIHPVFTLLMGRLVFSLP